LTMAADEQDLDELLDGKEREKGVDKKTRKSHLLTSFFFLSLFRCCRRFGGLWRPESHAKRSSKGEQRPKRRVRKHQDMHCTLWKSAHPLGFYLTRFVSFRFFFVFFSAPSPRSRLLIHSAERIGKTEKRRV